MPPTLATAPAAASVPPPVPDMTRDQLIAQRLRHILDLYEMPLGRLSRLTGIAPFDLGAVAAGDTPLSVTQLLAIADAVGLHPMAFTDGIGPQPVSFIHPALLDREAGDMALRLTAMPKVGRALLLAMMARVDGVAS